jgi:hypothetical protein
MNKVDNLLFERLDVYRRLSTAFDDAEERFWKHLGETLGTIVKEVAGPTIQETFSTTDFGYENGYAYRKEWVLDFGDAAEELAEWERAPSFWFPESSDDFDLFALMGLNEEIPMDAVVWGTPLSRFNGDLGSAQRLWNKVVAGPLKKNGWEPYGERVIRPTGEWGVRMPIRLDHHKIAEAMESGDLRAALNPLQRAVEDFASVCTAMDEVVKGVLAAKGPSRRKS